MRRLLRKFRIPLGIVASLVALVVGGGVVISVLGLQDEIGKADVGLVLGGKVERTGRPSTALQALLDRALELYRRGCFPCVIVSGGRGKEGFDEAEVMGDYLVARGVPTERVIRDGHGDTTFASAKNTRRIAAERGFGSVLVVSQYFHITPARLALRRFGFATVYSAHAYLFDPRDLYSIPREAVGYAAYLVRRYE